MYFVSPIVEKSPGMCRFVLEMMRGDRALTRQAADAVFYEKLLFYCVVLC